MRSEERTGWTSKGKLKGTVGDFNKVMEALDFLRQKEISTVESLDAYLDKVSGEILSAKTDIRKSERQIKAIDTTLSHIANHGAYKVVYKKVRFHRLENPEGEICQPNTGRTGRLPCRQAFLQSPSGGTAL